jgi:Methylase involved in ubiquinone/menaquinone biosynthesis
MMHNTDAGRAVDNKAKYTWEEAIKILRGAHEHRTLIYNSYLTSDLVDNCHRFYASFEFKETLRILKEHVPPGGNVLDMPAGNGIATYAIVKEGFSVTSIEPDPSDTVGRGAIEFVLHAENINNNVTIIDGHGENISLADETFDAVYVRQGLHHARDLQKMVNEINRVLKKGRDFDRITGARSQ